MTAGANRSVTHTVTVGDRKIVYELTRKKVKNINLRIKPDGSVHVSASNAVTIAVIERFMKKKSDFILSAIDKYSERGVKGKMQFVGGEKLPILGRERTLYVLKATRNSVTDKDGNITLSVTDTDDYELKYKVYITWLKAQCLEIMNTAVQGGIRRILWNARHFVSCDKGEGYALKVGELYTVKGSTYIQCSPDGISVCRRRICSRTRIYSLLAGKSQCTVL